MILYFLRHGLAGDRDKWTDDDRLRPLTSKGKDHLEKSAKTLEGLIPDLDAILTSPLVRARQTAEIVADELGMKDEIIIDERLEPGFNLEKLAEILPAYPEAEALMLVGHEPDFSETVSALIGGGDVIMKKGGVARVDLTSATPPAGQLAWLLPPKAID